MKTLNTYQALFLSLLTLASAPVEAQMRPRPRPANLALESSQNYLNHFQIALEMSFRDDASADLAFQSVAHLTYHQMMKRERTHGNKKAGEIITARMLEDRYLAQSQDENYDNLNLNQRAKRLQKFARDYAGVNADQGSILSELIIIELKEQPQSWKQTLAIGQKNLNFEEKLNIATQLGGDFSTDYNNERADDNNAQGYYDVAELLERLSTAEAGGVCRDISLAQAQVLKELGVPHENLYLMGYTTATNSHAVMIVQDPENPDKVIRVNYSAAESSEQMSGASALNISGSLTNTGIKYRMYDADGKPVETVTSEIGQVLREVTGGDRKFEGDMPGFSIQKIVLASKIGRATVFSGQTHSNGDNYVGVSFDTTINPGGMDEFYEVGLAIIDRQGNRARESVDQQMAYARIKYWIEKERNLGPVALSAKLGTEAEFAAMKNRVVRTADQATREGTNFDAKLNGFAGIEASMKTGANTSIFSGIDITSYLDFKNVAAASSGGFTVVVDHVNVYAGSTHQMGNVLGTGQAVLTVREVGNTMTLKAGLQHTKIMSAIEMRYQKPLDDIPTFFEGSSETFSARAEKQWISNRKGKRGAGTRAYIDVIHDEFSGDNVTGFGLEIRW